MYYNFSSCNSHNIDCSLQKLRPPSVSDHNQVVKMNTVLLLISLLTIYYQRFICTTFVINSSPYSTRFLNVPTPSFDCIEGNQVNTLSTPIHPGCLSLHQLSSSSEIQDSTDLSSAYEAGFCSACDAHRIGAILISLAVIIIWSNVFLIKDTGLYKGPYPPQVSFDLQEVSFF